MFFGFQNGHPNQKTRTNPRKELLGKVQAKPKRNSSDEGAQETELLRLEEFLDPLTRFFCAWDGPPSPQKIVAFWVLGDKKGVFLCVSLCVGLFVRLLACLLAS